MKQKRALFILKLCLYELYVRLVKGTLHNHIIVIMRVLSVILSQSCMLL